MIRATPLLHVRALASRLLAAAAVLPDGWDVKDARRLDERAVLVALGPEEGPGALLEWRAVPEGGEPVRAFVVGSRYAVSYRSAPTAWDLDDAETPVDIKRAVARACQILALTEAEDVLGVGMAAGAASSLDAPVEVPFEATAVAGWLATALPHGAPLTEEWTLSDVYPFGPEEVAVAFSHPGHEMQPRIKLRPRDDERPAARRTRSLDITYTLPFGRGNDSERARRHATLAAELALVLETLDRGVRFIVASGPRAGSAAEGPPPSAINVAIPAPCGLRCSFCSVREEIHPMGDAEPAYIEALRSDITRAAARGTRVMRLNGMEPLAAPYVFDLLDLARREGFDEVHVLSTFLPAADRELARRLLATMPAKYRLYVPIYGASPEVHDAVTGRPGSFDDLMAAVGHFRELMPGYPGGDLIFTTILMKENAADMLALSTLVKPLGRWWEVHLPFPNTSSSKDRYRDVALPMSQALDVLYPPDAWPFARLDLGEVLPCIALRHQRRTGHQMVTPERVAQARREPSGTFYETIGFTHSLGDGEAVAFTAATVPCPGRDACVMAPTCPTKVYAAYAEKFGLDELTPIQASDLAVLPDGAQILSYIQERRQELATL